MKQKYKKRFIDVEYTVPWTISHLTFHGMVKILASMNLANLDVIYTPSHHLLKSQITEHKKDHSWFTQTAKPH